MGSTRNVTTPRRIDALCGVGVTQLSCGMYHTLALTDSGEVYSFGFGGSFFNGAGGLGHGDRKQRDVPMKLAAFGPGTGLAASTVSAGGYHSVVLDNEGGVWTWGRGEWGRLGHDDASDCLEPKRVEGNTSVINAVTKVVTAQAGEGHTGVLGSDGLAYTWGRNEHWQLGYEVVGLFNSGQSFDAQQVPMAVPIDTGSAGQPTTEYLAARFACGEQGSAAVLSDDSIYVWGMQRFFEPTLVPRGGEIGSPVVDMQVRDVHVQCCAHRLLDLLPCSILLCLTSRVCCGQLGATHLAVRTQEGKVFTFGSGTALGLPKANRKSWELCELTAHSLLGSSVVGMACGPHSTALIVQ